MEDTTSLHLADYIVIGLVLLYSVGVGIYYRFTGREQKSAVEYFSANKSLETVPFGLAIMFSLVSAIILIGISGETYANGTTFVVAYLIGFLISPLFITDYYIPVMFQFEKRNLYEYLKKRFGVRARLATSMANYFQLTFVTGVVLFVPSLAIEATTGLSSYKSILILGIICIFYSAITGIKEVLVPDLLQGVLMFVSILIAVLFAHNHIDGGLLSVWKLSREGNRLVFLDLKRPTIPHKWFSSFIGSFFTFLSLYGVNQVKVERFKAIKYPRQISRDLCICTVLTVAIGALTACFGLVLYAVYKDCDPKTAGLISSYDKILPYFVATEMSAYPGIAGLFVAGVFCASLSTVSAMLNSLAALFLEDYLKPLHTKFGKAFPANKATLYGKIMSTINGLVIMGVAFLAGHFESLIVATISIFGSISGPILGTYTLGLFFENSNEIGAIIGMMTAIFTCLYAGYGHKVPVTPLPISTNGCNFDLSSENVFYLASSIENNENEVPYIHQISYMYYCFFGFLITLFVGYTASIIINKLQAKTNKDEIDASLFTPCIAEKIRYRRNKEKNKRIENNPENNPENNTENETSF